jgi:hypothetical protein
VTCCQQATHRTSDQVNVGGEGAENASDQHCMTWDHHRTRSRYRLSPRLHPNAKCRQWSTGMNRAIRQPLVPLDRSLRSPTPLCRHRHPVSRRPARSSFQLHSGRLCFLRMIEVQTCRFLNIQKRLSLQVRLLSRTRHIFRLDGRNVDPL